MPLLVLGAGRDPWCPLWGLVAVIPESGFPLLAGAQLAGVGTVRVPKRPFQNQGPFYLSRKRMRRDSGQCQLSRSGLRWLRRRQRVGRQSPGLEPPPALGDRGGLRPGWQREGSGGGGLCLLQGRTRLGEAAKRWRRVNF